MEIGMLWFDNSPSKSLEEKIREAVSYYLTKYGKQATMVHVNASQLPPDFRITGIKVEGSRYVLPNHLWVGVGNKS